jgi:hypothetical protein
MNDTRRDSATRRLEEITTKRKKWYGNGKWSPYDPEINRLTEMLATGDVESEQETVDEL